VKFAMIQSEQQLGPVSWLCAAVSVSRSGYYSWRRRTPSARSQRDRRLLLEVRASYEASGRVYGSPRVTKDLRAAGYAVGENRVARLMRHAGIVAVPRRRRRPQVSGAHDYPVPPNVLEQEFTVAAPNRVWAADITYIPTEEGWLYVAGVMDLYARRIVGWHAAGRVDRWLTLTALERALRVRRPPPGLVHHSDQGSQYACYEYQQRLEQAQAVTSMSRRGNCYDNAAMESFFGSLKKERVHRRTYWTRKEAIADIADYIENFYNPRRRHSNNDGLSPIAFEQQRHLT
jgi:transposase InsO family protein